MTVKETISVNLKKYRKEKNMLQKDVAFKLGIKIFTYQSYEEARATPTIETLLKLKKVYNLTSIEKIITA